MKQLQRRQGFTLVEVIVSLVILSVITISLLSFFASGYSNTLLLRNQNDENFEVQAYFEEEMAKAKKSGANGTDELTFVYRVGNGSPKEITVVGKHLTYPTEKAVRKTQLFVSNQREAVLDLPTDLKASIAGNPAPTYLYLGDKVPAGTVSRTGTAVDNVKVELRESWLLSHRSIGDNNLVPVGTLVASGNEEGLSTVVLPTMSNTTRDVKELSSTNYPSSGFTVTNEMRGKYLTFGGRAVSTLGRVGSYVTAQPIWIMGVPIVNGLSVHTDVDLATTKAKGPIPSDGEAYTDIEVKDYRNNVTFTGNIPIQSIVDQKIGQPRQFITFNGDEMYFSKRNLEASTTSVRIGNQPQSGQLLKYEVGSLKWVVNLTEGGAITVDVTDDTLINSSGSRETTVTNLDYSKDHSIHVRTSKLSGQEVLKVEVFLDGSVIHSENLSLRGLIGNSSVTHPASSARIYFGGKTYINELAMYTRALSDTELTTLTTYFSRKYDTTYNSD